MMVNLMRSNQRWMMIIISVLVIISFLWFYSDRTNIDRMVSDRVGSIYGRTVTTHEFGQVERRLQVARSLGTYDIFRAASGDGYEQEQAPVNYLVLEHEAEKLGIHPTTEEIRVAGEKLPAFRGADGEYDRTKYDEFVNRELNWRGLGPNQIDEIVRMNLIAAKLRSIVLSTVVVTPMEARTRYDEYQAKTEASVIRLKAADYATVAELTDEEVAKYFNDQKDQFKQPERRKVQYVKFGLDEAQAKLQGKPRMEALKPLADHAVQLLEKLLDQKGKEDFPATVAAESLTLKETPEFEEEQTTGFEEANIPQFAQAAFKLSKNSPDSDVPLETSDAFYDLHLSSVTPERPLAPEEAKPKVVAAIKTERTKAALTAKAEEIRTKISEAIKAGKSFADAAKEAGVAAEDLPAFSRAEPDRKTPGAEEIAGISQDLSIGEISKFVHDNDGGLLVYVRSRAGSDEAKFETAKSSFTMQMQNQKDQIYFFEWLRTSRENANAKFNLRSQS